MKPLKPFQPPWWLRNPHLQSFLASTHLRRAKLKQQAAPMLATAQQHILPCGPSEHGDIVRLQAFYSPQTNQPEAPLVIFIHGWEGSVNSSYLLSAAGALYAAGYAVLRLNMRDHGESHYLNRGIFSSARTAEVITAVDGICARYTNAAAIHLVGFSLGANFALRIAADLSKVNSQLKKVVAISPLLDPADSLALINQGRVYRQYFLRKWKRSLQKKALLYPEYFNYADYAVMDNFDDLTAALTPHIEEATPKQHYAAYSLLGERLANLRIPAHLLMAKDDPTIRHELSAELSPSASIQLTKTSLGGHCGFIKNRHLASWANDYILHCLAIN